MSKAALRSIKNVVNGYTSAQIKVRNGKLVQQHCFTAYLSILTLTATSNEPNGPSTSDMEELAELTYEQ